MKNRTLRTRTTTPCLRPGVFAALSFLSTLPALHAQELLAQASHVPALQETVVTATRTAQPLTDIVADVSIVDRETIESAGATGLVDLLARLPGGVWPKNEEADHAAQ